MLSDEILELLDKVSDEQSQVAKAEEKLTKKISLSQKPGEKICVSEKISLSQKLREKICVSEQLIYSLVVYS